MVIGTILAGRYKIIESLPSKGLGESFKAEDIYLPGQPSCIVKCFKSINIEHGTSEIAKQLFEREAGILYKLGNHHNQIPGLMAQFSSENEFFLVQEYIEGHTLAEEICLGQQMSEESVIAILHSTLQVLSFVHNQQIIHHDIRPSNLIRRKSDNKIVLINFGAAKDISQVKAHFSPPNNQVLTVDSLKSISNDQLAEQPQFRIDIYALGMMCLQALTGLSPKKMPKDNRTNDYSCALVSEFVNIRISAGLSAIINKMLRYDYRQRYKDAAEALSALDQFIGNATPVKTSSILKLQQRSYSEEPEGQVDLASAFYVERPPIEKDCFETVVKPGALIRIKGALQMGKSSLLSRTLAHARQQGCQVVHLYLRQADSDIMAELDLFLQWFCTSIASELGLDDNLDEYWQGVLGSKNKCTKYFQRYLLTTVKVPLVLGLDELDLVFKYPKIASDFLGLLRAWHEKAKNEDIWKRLRLVIVHSKEVYVPLNINQSPFNVGLPIELPEFTYAQVERLIDRYQLKWEPAEVEKLMALTGGHPYLTRQALYQIARGRISLEKLLHSASSEEGIYGNHLRYQLNNLQEDHELVNAFKELIASDKSLQMDGRLAFKLRGIGLVKFHGNQVVPMCNLYRQYFRQSLGVL